MITLAVGTWFKLYSPFREQTQQTVNGLHNVLTEVKYKDKQMDHAISRATEVCVNN